MWIHFYLTKTEFFPSKYIYAICLLKFKQFKNRKILMIFDWFFNIIIINFFISISLSNFGLKWVYFTFSCIFIVTFDSKSLPFKILLKNWQTYIRQTCKIFKYCKYQILEKNLVLCIYIMLFISIYKICIHNIP